MAHEEQAAAEGVRRCSCGSDYDALELGKEGQSVLAVFGAPYQHIRCAECGFTAPNGNSRDEAIEQWNAAIAAKEANHAG
jgi:hypothetical protein